jgi:hypothetical protein
MNQEEDISRHSETNKVTENGFKPKFLSKDTKLLKFLLRCLFLPMLLDTGTSLQMTAGCEGFSLYFTVCQHCVSCLNYFR